MNVSGADLALPDMVSSGVGYALNAAAFNNDAANIGEQMAGKLCGRDGALQECRQIISQSPLEPRARPCYTGPYVVAKLSYEDLLGFLLAERHKRSSCTFAKDEFVRRMRLPSEMLNDGCHLMTAPLKPQTLSCGDASGVS